MSAIPEAIQKLSRDLRAAAKLMGVREARYFVNTYYDPYPIAHLGHAHIIQPGRKE